MPGASWKTAIVGWVLIGSSVLALIADIIAKQGFPTSMMEWFSFGTALAAGIAAVLAKDYDVSNSPTPVAAAIVSTANAVKTNPSTTT